MGLKSNPFKFTVWGLEELGSETQFPESSQNMRTSLEKEGYL